jgi:hypothetical protein
MYDTGLVEGVALAEIRRTLTALARELEPSTLALSEAKVMLGELVAVKNVAAAVVRPGRRSRRPSGWSTFPQWPKPPRPGSCRRSRRR